MDIVSFLIAVPIIAISAILHEIAHGFVADKLGDPTARLYKRLTLNPLPHIDPYMTIILPIALYVLSHGTFIFAAAKPVPIDPYNLKDGKKDIALVALAGPLTNLGIATTVALILHLAGFNNSPFIELLKTIAGINILLGVFNLLPLPPLDGSKIFALILPDGISQTYLSFGNNILFSLSILFLLLSFPIGEFFLPTFIQHIYILIASFLGL